MRLNIEVDVSQLRRDLRQLQGDIYDTCFNAVKRAHVEAPRHARLTRRYQDQTYTLTESIEGRNLRSTQDGAQALMVAMAPYASFVAKGTRPHVIRPRRARVLAWRTDNGTGNWAFAKKVNHPGTIPYRFDSEMEKRALEIMLDDCRRGVDAAVARFNSY